MLFVEWTEVRKFIYASLCLIPPIRLFFNARGRKDKLLPWLSLIFALVFSAAFILWGLGIGNANDELPAVYSPDGKFAARLSVGPLGEQVVELFSWHGLRKHVVYRGDTDDERSLRWTAVRTLQIPVQGPPNSCMSSAEVEVICAPTRR